MGTGEVLRRCLKRGVSEEYRRFFLSKRLSSFEFPGSARADSALYPPKLMRKISIIAHVDHGKSSFLDPLLKLTGTIRKGHGQPQYLDKLQVGRERGITVKAQTGSMVYSYNNERKKYLLNLIDTPAHVDFSCEVSRSLAACQECRTFLSQGHNLRKNALTEASGLNKIRLSGLGGKGLVRRNPRSVRCISTQSALAAKQQSGRQEKSETGITTQEDPFDTLTDKIPVQPVTVAEGASYSVAILAGLAVAGAAAYTIFKELIVEPKEYKVYGKALDRVQTDMQIAGRLGSPIHGYGQESQNRSARQRISNRQWVDEDGVEHVEVMFHVRGPGGGGKVFCEMFKDPEDKSWKFTYLIVDVTHPTPKRFLLESYVPEVKVNLSAA